MIAITILTAGIKHKNFMIFMAGLTCSASFETSPIQPRRPLRPRWTVLCSVDLRYLLPNRWILLRHCCPLVVPNQNDPEQTTYQLTGIGKVILAA